MLHLHFFSSFTLQFLGNLKVLNLSHSHLLTKTPHFSTIPSIEELILEDCVALKEVHQSIGDLKELVLLNLKDCKRLPTIPGSICQVKSLRFLNICGCSKINKLPNNIGDMESLSEFLADGTSIKQVPPCIVQLKNLTKLSLSGCKKSRSASISSPWSWISAREDPQGNGHLISSLSGLNLLKSLTLMDCNLSDDAITPVGIENLQSLETLNLGKNNFHYLPGAISCLLKLRHIILDECTNLKSLANLPPSLYMLEAANCTSLENVSIENSCGTLVLYLTNCTILEEVSGFDDWNNDGVMELDGCRNLSNNFKEFLFKVPSPSLSSFFFFGKRSIFLKGKFFKVVKIEEKVKNMTFLGNKWYNQQLPLIEKINFLSEFHSNFHIL